MLRRILGRINGVWLVAGSVLFAFGANELAAYALARVPRWLGGGYAACSGASAMVMGALVAALLGLRPPPEDSEDEAPPASAD